MTEKTLVDGHVHKLRMDAARWVVPQSVRPVGDVTFLTFVKLAYRHLPLRAMAWFRLGCALKARRVPMLPGLLQRRLLLKYGLELMVGAEIGGGLYIAHPVGCVLMADRVGENVTVVASVTFGMRNEPVWPTIGDEVFVGTGARILGGITLGRGAVVGANAVVVHDVEPGVTVVGIPARPVRSG